MDNSAKLRKKHVLSCARRALEAPVSHLLLWTALAVLAQLGPATAAEPPAPSAEARAVAAFQRGDEAARRGDEARARALWAAAGQFRPLAGLAAERLAASFEASAAIARALSAVPPDDPRAGAAAMALARTLRKAGDLRGARRAAQRAWRLAAEARTRCAARLEEARVALAAGKRSEAVRIARHVWWTRRRCRKAALRVLRDAHRAPGADARLLADLLALDRAQARRRARVLRRRARHFGGRAGKVLRELTRALTWTHLPSMRKAAHAHAVHAWRKARKLKGLRPWAAYAVAETLRRLDRHEEAVAWYERLAREAPSHPMTPRALLEASRLDLLEGHAPRARRRLEALCREWPRAPESARARWLLALDAIHRNEPGAARRALRALLAQWAPLAAPTGETWGERARYWLGRTAAASGETAAARAWWRDLVRTAPNGYYGVLAAAALGRLGKVARERPSAGWLCVEEEGDGGLDAARQRSPEPHDRLDAAWPAVWPGWTRAARALAAANRVRDARALIEPLAQRHLLDEDGWRLLLDTTPPASLAHTLRRFAVAVPRVWPAHRAAWHKVVPAPYLQLAAGVATVEHLPLALVLAVIYAESGGNPSARSPVGAVGLMQLMPATARAIAETAWGVRIRLRDLRLPEVNVRLGARILAGLRDRYAGNWAVALAAYATGAGRVDGWASRWAGTPTDVFVETMPFRTVRAYVKRVLSLWVRYALVYGPPARTGLPFELPPQVAEPARGPTARN